MKTALLLSGGMDSTAIAYWMHPECAITVEYGQRPAAGEVRAAAAVADALGLEHHIVHADLSALGSGDMAGSPPHPYATHSEWWPFRNQMLVTLAGMKALALGVQRILIGTLKTDCGHADGTSQFVQALNQLMRLQEGGIIIEAPAIDLNAVDLVRISRVPMEILAWAHSCHVAEHACGLCRGCRKHYETMVDLGFDPY